MATTPKAKDEFHLKNKVVTDIAIDCTESDQSIQKQYNVNHMIMSPLYLIIKKLDEVLFNQLPKSFGDKYETKDNPCLSQQQADLINKKKALQRKAILFMLQLLLMCGCLMHLFYFTSDILGKDALPKLLCSFLVLFDPGLYIGIIIILYYISKFKPANDLYEGYIIGFIDQIKKPLFKTIPIFDKYTLFLSKAVKEDPPKILSYYYSIEPSCGS